MVRARPRRHSGLKVLHEPLAQRAVGQRARLAGDLLAATVEYQGGNTANLELRAGLRLCIGVEFRKADAWFVGRSGLVEDRRKLYAGPAPGGPAIDDQGQVVAAEQGPGIGVGHRERFADEQGLVTTAAVRRFA